MDDLTQEFLAESLEGLDRMERCLTELETRPNDASLVGEIFRAVHTIKGTTGFLGFSRLETLAHAGENLLGALRAGTLHVTVELVNGLLQLLDGLRGILLLIDRTGREGGRAGDNDDELLALMEMLRHGEQATPRRPSEPEGESLLHPAGAGDRTLRIDVDVLNRMVNLVGELVLTRNQLMQGRADSAGFPELVRQLDCVTAELRETVMHARMQPVGHLFGKFPRVVRDLARSCGKQVRMEFVGQDTGLDKTLLEAIKDPLTHALRNAIDHGIEGPRERMLAGKPVQGTVWMRARHEGGAVVIEIEDDGAGIRRERVLAKAVAAGLISEAATVTMSDREVEQLIFLPGFSTAEAVSHVSGRGVGLDVVRTNVEKVGGTIQVASKLGAGTLLRLQVPLTLAIVPALVVQSGGESFCLPQSALVELVCVPKDDADQVVETIGDVEVFRLREELVPLVWLDRLLELHAARRERCANGFYVAVTEAEGYRFALALDEVLSPEEIVVKPLSVVLRESGLFLGATVLGNGKLAMILDLPATAAKAGLQRRELNAEKDGNPGSAPEEKRAMFLLCDVGTGKPDARSGEARERLAFPLEAVERIETVGSDAVDWMGGRPMLHYRGELLLLEDRGQELQRAGEQSREITVLICQERGGRRMGLVVRQVLDVSHGHETPRNADDGSPQLAHVQGRLTAVHPLCRVPGPMADLREVA